jgi:hypothetical protein
MSHWSGENVSASVAGEFGRSPGCRASASAAGSATFEPKPAVDATPSMRPSFESVEANDALFERAMATPIWS